jgi:multidrug resistance efflux pump
MSDDTARMVVTTPGQAAASVKLAPEGSWKPPTRSWVITALIGVTAVVAVLLILLAWRLPPFNGGVEVTDNAYVRGRTTVIAPQVSGYVVQVAVRDYEQVRAAQVLVRIDDRIYRARVAQARADLDARQSDLANNRQAHASRAANIDAQKAAVLNANAQLLRSRADMARVTELVQDGSVSVRERDQTLAALRASEAQTQQAEAAEAISMQDLRTVDVSRDGLVAQVEAARAQLRLAEIDLEHTVIVAPEAGKLSEVGVRDGQYVTNGTALVYLVPPDLWVIANFKEAQTGRMRPGQKASFTVDALGGARVFGRVERLSPAAGSEFSVLKPDNATGNFVKVPQRIGIRIAIDAGQALAHRLRAGMSVEARVDTRDRQ